MQKVLVLSGAVLMLAACAATGTETTQPQTVADVYQTSQDLRQKVTDAKTTYETAKTGTTAASAATDTGVVQTVKDAVNTATGNAVSQAQAEKDAWKNALNW